MKTNILTLMLSLVTLVAVAQKKEIRNAGKAVDEGNYAEAKAELNKAENMLADANDRWTERFYLYKGKAYAGNGEDASVEDLSTAADAFEQAMEMGSSEAEEGLMMLKNTLVQSAIKDQNVENYQSASEKLRTSYELNKQDTLYLYYAAVNSLNAEDYNTALEYFEELKDLGYSGEGTEYVATNIETGEEDVWPNKGERDLLVKGGTHDNPQERKIPSKRGEIAKYIALIYINEGEDEKAMEAMEDARRENPEDVSLIQAEADMYYRMDDMQKYRELMEEVVEKNPNDPTVYYNLGVSATELGDNEAAIEYYEKALELDPTSDEAELNIAAIVLGREREIIDEMNELGTSKADYERYDELEKERNQIYTDALPYLERIIERSPDNIEAIKTARNIYSIIDETEKAEEMNKLLEQ